MSLFLPAYAELHALSNFSFQRGASHAEELVERAKALGYSAMAITDECSVAGVVRAHVAAKAQGLQLLPGAEFAVHGVKAYAEPSFKLVVLPHNVEGWGALCQFITAAKHAGEALSPGSYRVARGETNFARLRHCEILLCPLPQCLNEDALTEQLQWARDLWGEQLWLAVELLQGLDDALRLAQLQRAAQRAGVPLVAAGAVLMHVRSRKPLHDVMTAVALGCTVQEAGVALQANAEAHLRPRMRLADIYPPELLAHTLTVAGRCHFSLDAIRALYRYPQQDIVPSAESPAQCLRRLTHEGAGRRYVGGMPTSIAQQVEHELGLIEELGYEMYFITVYDIVRFAREQNILCQGRGSAANSAVCFCLGITAINPAESNLLFERFISRERQEPPDIDVDFEHQRREEVIQYIYAKYGHDRAAIAATVIRYQPRSALRDVGKALGLPADLIDRFAKDSYWFDGRDALAQKLMDAGFAAEDGALQQWLELTQQLIGTPRHLSQHVGGFVLTQGLLTRLVPVQPASMEARYIIQWDKDDLDTMGLLKVDVLALGMLSAIRRCLALIDQTRGGGLEMHQIPADDSATYDMICQADTVGVFQIESRAQMAMLPRLKPRCYYDLVVQVAIVRPGPIQGGMVHPYLQRRELIRMGGQVLAEYPALDPALGRTLGVPIFQEQVMQIAMIAADFSPGEADDLRRSMAAWKRKGGVQRFRERLIGRMVEKNYSLDFAERIFSQIEGFGEYGFPESHAASFAKLVYVSCWLKCHEPACFLAAMLNSQPLGFYAPSQLVQDARRHGVEVRAVDVTQSHWESTLEPAEVNVVSASYPGIHPGQPAVRMGLNLVSSLSQAGVHRLLQARARAPFTSTEDLALRAELGTRDLQALAAADALAPLAGHRRQQVWETAALQAAPRLFKAVPTHEAPLQLAPTPEGENILFDYQSTGLTLRRHPLALLRPRLAARGLQSASQLNALPGGRRVAACGIVTVRQQPGTAKGTVFVTLEDETGPVNVIVGKPLRQKQRQELLGASLLAVWGVWQRNEDPQVRPGYGPVRNLIAHRLEDLSPLLGRLGAKSRDFH